MHCRTNRVGSHVWWSSFSGLDARTSIQRLFTPDGPRRFEVSRYGARTSRKKSLVRSRLLDVKRYESTRGEAKTEPTGNGFKSRPPYCLIDLIRVSCLSKRQRLDKAAPAARFPPALPPPIGTRVGSSPGSSALPLTHLKPETPSSSAEGKRFGVFSRKSSRLRAPGIEVRR